MRENILRDSLYNLHMDNTLSRRRTNQANKFYGRGVLTGLVSALMAFEDLTFKEAVETIRPHLYEGTDIDCIPESWQEDFGIVDMEAENE